MEVLLVVVIWFLGLIGLILFFVWLFMRKSRIKGELKTFFEKYDFTPQASLPVSISTFLRNNFHSVTSYHGLINKNGEQFPFFWIYGFPKPAFYYNKTNTYVEPYLLLFFPPYTLSSKFITQIGQSVKSPSFKNILLTWDTDHPIEIKLIDEKYFMVKWQSRHKVDSFEKRLQWLYQNIC
ncbi:MAG: hypothetical protein K1X72_14365 [Pyrinomonadaceae bacterium]|nr:hypothetical protein [Pyrinomonadaceae bacterium]